MASKLLTSDFNYPLPADRIAMEPMTDRHAARLLVRSAAGQLRHEHIGGLPGLLPPGTLLIVNDSRVIPARTMGRTRTGAQAEIFLLEPLDAAGQEWKALGKPFRKLARGATVDLPGDGQIVVLDAGNDSGQPWLRVRFQSPATGVLSWLDRWGTIPLPPYITRDRPPEAGTSRDARNYQTVYAREKGSVAAPTAGLHFTPALLDQLRSAGIGLAGVTLHVGSGTFLPVKAADPDQHAMHDERFLVPAGTLTAIRQARQEKRPVVAVGTTALRSLEALALENGAPDQWHRTNLFIRARHRDERYHPRLVDGLLTNFHQPESTLFMLICALLGFDKAHAVYRTAVEENYRFFSYGDACLFWLRSGV